MPMQHTAVIGLGSNLGDSQDRLKQAILALTQIPQLTLIKQSSFYNTKPWGPVQDQPDFINAIVIIKTTLSPTDLLTVCQEIEYQQGRRRDGLQFGPRVIDLDILLYDHLQIKTERLTIPHPRMMERDFVLKPLLELLT